MLNKILQTLMFKKRIKTAQLAREVGMSKQSLNRIVNGTTINPHAKNLLPLADYFSVSVAQLKGDEPLPEKMVDIQLPTSKPKAKTIPILDWQDLAHLDKIDFEQVKDNIFVSPDLSDQAFATPLIDMSMEPIFRKGSVLIIDPHRKFNERSFVLVKINEAEQVVFRQLLLDADHRYLKAISPDFSAFPMRLLKENDEVLGVLVEARQVF